MTPCAVALVLLLDASGSIGASAWAAQVAGHASAVESPEVTRHIERGPIAVKAVAFADVNIPLTPWHVLRTRADAQGYALALRTSLRPMSGGTLIGHAIRDALRFLEAVPCDADERVIDLVSDGEADAREASPARDQAHAAGVRINALGVGPASAAAWLREHAVTPGGFAMQVEDWDGFARAMVRKLSLEVAAR